MLPYFFSARPIIFRFCAHALPVTLTIARQLRSTLFPFCVKPLPICICCLAISLSLSLSFYLSLYFLYRKDCEVDAAVPNVSAVQRATVRTTCHTRTMHCQRLNVSCRRTYDTPTRESMCPRIPMVLSINAGRVRRDRTTFRVHTYAGVNFLRFQHQ